MLIVSAIYGEESASLRSQMRGWRERSGMPELSGLDNRPSGAIAYAEERPLHVRAPDRYKTDPLLFVQGQLRARHFPVEMG